MANFITSIRIAFTPSTRFATLWALSLFVLVRAKELNN